MKHAIAKMNAYYACSPPRINDAAPDHDREFHSSVGVIDSCGREVIPLRSNNQRVNIHADGLAYGVDAKHRLLLYGPGTDNLAENLTLPVWSYLGEGLAHAYRGSNRVVVALDGRILFDCGPPPKNSSVMGLSFREGLLTVRSRMGERKWGAIDSSGNLVIPYLYDSRFSFTDGKAAVKLNGRPNAIFLKDFVKSAASKLAEEETPVAQDPAELKAVVSCINPTAPFNDRVYVLQYGKHRSQGYNSIRTVADKKVAVVKSAGAVGLIDFTGKELIIPTQRYSNLSVGDPLITAEMRCETNCHDRRKAYGYLDLNGNVKLGFRYSNPRTFRNGQSWTIREIRNPDLEMFRHPEDWFTDNRTVFRSGKGNGYCIQSLKTPGRYARILSGYFENGKLKDGQADLEDPRYGRVVGEYKNAALAKTLRYWTPDGREIHAQLNAAWQVHGMGHSYRRDGSIEFVGEWLNGNKWKGTGYIQGNETHREDWLDGVNRGLREVGYAFRPKNTAETKPKPGTRTMSCNHCGGRGVVYLQARYVKVKDTSLILAGSQYYGTRYTHFEHDTERKVEIRPSGYVTCGTCNGTRFIRY